MQTWRPSNARVWRGSTVRFGLGLLGLVAGGLAARAENYEVKSPDGALRFVLTLAPGGVPTYEVFAGTEAVVRPSRLGLTTNHNVQGNTDWTEGFAVVDAVHDEHRESWHPLWGERSEVPDNYNRLCVSLRQAPAQRGPLQIEVRAYDEGVAFRYVFPEDRTTRVLEIAGERTEFNLPAGAQGYWTPSAQRAYVRGPVANWPRDCEMPLTLELPGGRWMAIAEAGLDNYAATRLRLAGTDALVTQLFGDVTETSPFATPWRVLLIANEPGRLLEHNYLIGNLNPASVIADTSWIHPGKVLREMTLSTAGAKRTIDFAVEQNVEYILFDAGWYGYENDATADATRVSVDPRRNPRGDLDLPEVIRYAKAKGRRVILYVNHRALERQLDVILPLYRQWGVDGVKFGFVQTGSHRWTTWLADAIRRAAENHLVLGIHDNYRPSGLSRTYPNLLTQEGILGNEAFPDATQDTMFPFTRFLAGAADYTFCFNEPRLTNTKAHQFALTVIYFSPLQSLYWYGRPENYPDRKEIEFWRDLPVVWDDTRVLGGRPGEFVAVARRHGDDWWVGGITNVTGRTLDLSLGFLAPGKSWTAEIYEDADKNAIAHRQVTVTSGGTLHCELRGSGGVAIRLH